MKHICHKCGAENTVGYVIKSGPYKRKRGRVYRSEIWRCRECSRNMAQARKYKLMPPHALDAAIDSLRWRLTLALRVKHGTPIVW